MNKNYTPAPWKESVNMGANPIVVTEDEFICQVAPGNHTNAQLISAAPDLVEALQAQIRETQRLYQLTKDIEYKGKASAIEMYDCIVDEAIDALTKAGVLTKET